MKVTRTLNDGQYLRLEDENEAAVTFLRNGRTALLLSIFVPGDARRNGIATGLLETAEAKLYEMGVRRLEADFLETSSDIKGFLENNGFKLSKGAPVVTIDAAELLSSDVTAKLLRRDIRCASFSALDELNMTEWDSLLGLLEKLGIPLRQKEVARFSQTMSGVAIDRRGELRAVVLCSEIKDSLHIEFLASAGKKSGEYILCALQGAIMELMVSGGSVAYSNITALVLHDGVRGLAGYLLKDEPEVIDTCIFAYKQAKEGIGKYVIDDIDERRQRRVSREIAKLPLQDNISKKCAWGRNKGAWGRNKGNVSHDAKAPPEQEFPYELGEPFDIQIGRGADEDESEEFLHEDTVWLSEYNIEKYKDLIPKDALWCIPRSHFRGLLYDSGEELSYIIYELVKADGKGTEYRAFIRWMKLAGSVSAEAIFEEYDNQIKNKDVIETVYEGSVKDTDVDLLEGLGFNTKKKESEDILVSVKDALGIPLSKGSILSNVTGLNDIEERQFKRALVNCVVHNKKGILEDILELPLEWFERDVSSCVITDNRVSSLFLLHQLPTLRLMIDLLFSSTADAEMYMSSMITRSVREAVKKYPPDTPVLIRRHSKTATVLTDRFFPGVRGETVVSAKRTEQGT